MLLLLFYSYMSLSKLSLIIPFMAVQAEWVDSNNCQMGVDPIANHTPESKVECGEWCLSPDRVSENSLADGDFCCGYELWTNGASPSCFL